MLCLPVTHDKPLEIKLILEEVVHSIGVLAAIGVVDLVVRAHDGTGARPNGICKRPSLVNHGGSEMGGGGGEDVLPEVELVHGLVIQVGTKALGDVEAISSGLGCLTEVLLFVCDIVLCAGNDPSILDASDGGIDQSSSQIWIWTETFLEELLDIADNPLTFDLPSSCRPLESGPGVRTLAPAAHRRLCHDALNPSRGRAHRQDRETR